MGNNVILNPPNQTDTNSSNENLNSISTEKNLEFPVIEEVGENPLKQKTTDASIPPVITETTQKKVPMSLNGPNERTLTEKKIEQKNLENNTERKDLSLPKEPPSTMQKLIENIAQKPEILIQNVHIPDARENLIKQLDDLIQKIRDEKNEMYVTDLLKKTDKIKEEASIEELKEFINQMKSQYEENKKSSAQNPTDNRKTNLQKLCEEFQKNKKLSDPSIMKLYEIYAPLHKEFATLLYNFHTLSADPSYEVHSQLRAPIVDFLMNNIHNVMDQAKEDASYQELVNQIQVNLDKVAIEKFAKDFIVRLKKWVEFLIKKTQMPSKDIISLITQLLENTPAPLKVLWDHFLKRRDSYSSYSPYKKYSSYKNPYEKYSSYSPYSGLDYNGGNKNYHGGRGFSKESHGGRANVKVIAGHGPHLDFSDPRAQRRKEMEKASQQTKKQNMPDNLSIKPSMRQKQNSVPRTPLRAKSSEKKRPPALAKGLPSESNRKNYAKPPRQSLQPITGYTSEKMPLSNPANRNLSPFFRPQCVGAMPVKYSFRNLLTDADACPIVF